MKKYKAIVGYGCDITLSEKDFKNTREILINDENNKLIGAKVIQVDNGSGVIFFVVFPIKDFEESEEKE